MLCISNFSWDAMPYYKKLHTSLIVSKYLPVYITIYLHLFIFFVERIDRISRTENLECMAYLVRLLAAVTGSSAVLTI